MDIELFIPHLHLSQRAIAKKLGISHTSARYWLKKYKLQTKGSLSRLQSDGTYRCAGCGETKSPSQFYKKKSGILHSSCKTCMTTTTLDRQRDFKSKCIAYMGGKCCLCGYNKYQGSFDFHHIDPSKKDFSLSKAKTKVFDDTIRRELDKCVLLCANCHREVHGGVADLILRASTEVDTQCVTTG